MRRYNSFWSTSDTSTSISIESSDNDEPLITTQQPTTPPPLNIIDHDNDNWPNTTQILNLINELPDNDPNKIAWDSLINNQEESKNANINDWYPFRNELCFLLFVGRFDPDRAITRQTMTYFCSILRTLQQNGHLNEDYFVPKNGNLIETWWKYLPTPPMREFFKSVVFFYPCTQIHFANHKCFVKLYYFCYLRKVF